MENTRGCRAVGVAVLLLLTVAAYLPATRGGFVFDDAWLIAKNPMVRAGDGLYRFWFTTEAPDYFPLTGSLWWLEWWLWGGSAMGYHAVNVGLHAVNAVLVWMVLRRLKIPGAWLAGALFAVHPVNVATVAWISEQKNTLSMLFYLIAILLYERFDDEGDRRWYGLSLAAFVLALLSKTAVVMLPVVLVGCVWWVHGRVQRKDWLRVAPFLVVSLFLGLVTIWFQHHRSMGGQVARTEGFAFRLVTAGWAPWFYLYKAFWPVNLSAVYPDWKLSPALWTSYLPGLAVGGCLAVFWWKRKTWGRPWLGSMGYFVVTLFPVLGFFDQSYQQYSFVADHWQYVAIVGPIALVAGAGMAVGHRIGGWGRLAEMLAGVGVVLALGIGTWKRCHVYETNVTLWQDTVTRNPDVWMAHNNLGTALQSLGKVAEAIGHYEEALRLRPDYADAYSNLGLALSREGRTSEAIAHCEHALQLNPHLAEAHYNLGIALVQAGRTDEAIVQYERALQITPTDVEVHYNLAVLLERAGRTGDAAAHYEDALRIDPDYAEAHNNLAVLLGRAGELEAAVSHYERAVQIDPQYAAAHNNLGVVLLRLGRIPEATDHFEEALRIQPEYTDAHSNLGVALSQAGRTEEAIRHYELAARLKPDSAALQYNLGLALEQMGKRQQAIECYERALQIDPGFAPAQNELARLRAGQ